MNYFRFMDHFYTCLIVFVIINHELNVSRLDGVCCTWWGSLVVLSSPHSLFTQFPLPCVTSFPVEYSATLFRSLCHNLNTKLLQSVSHPSCWFVFPLQIELTSVVTLFPFSLVIWTSCSQILTYTDLSSSIGL